MRTVYNVSYCQEKVEDALKPVKVDDEFLLHLRHTYIKTDIKQMPVPLTSRRIFGYMRKDIVYMPLTTYQDEVGEPGYKWLEKTRGKRGPTSL